jgi:Flp pilus assembly protein TadG
MRRKLPQQTHARRGAAMVEFALVSPLFLCLIVGIIEVGRAVVVQQLLTNASREGARYAGYDSTTQSSTVTNAVSAYLSDVGINGATTTVSPSLATVADGQPVTVSVSVPFTRVSLLPTPILLGNKTLQASTVMCREPAP